MRYRKSIEVPVAIAAPFAYVADFGNAAEWDPGLKESRRIVLVGSGAKAWSRDEVTFEPGGSSGGSGSGPGAASGATSATRPWPGCSARLTPAPRAEPMLERMSRTARMLCTLGVTVALVLLGVAAPPGHSAPARAGKAHPTPAELRAILQALPTGQRLCYRQLAWISGTDRRYAVIVTQATCGSSRYNHSWLRRAAAAGSGPWKVISVRGGTIDSPAGCATSKLVPRDIRCL